jgi:transcriptional regulator with XRE-family HTH domain
MGTYTMSTQTARPYATLLLAVTMDPKEIGRRIKVARNKRGWTQLAFALEADVSPSTIQRWESGQLPPVRELMRIAELLEVEPESLVELEPTGEDQFSALRAEVGELREMVQQLLKRRSA